MQVTNIPATAAPNGAVVEQAGIRMNYLVDGTPFETTRRPIDNGFVRYTVRNVKTGEETTVEVPAV